MPYVWKALLWASLGVSSPVLRAQEVPAISEAVLETTQGQASYYSDRFEGKRTASGRSFSQSNLWAAHRTYPFGTRLRVTNLKNGRQVEVQVWDRGPFGSKSRILDLSKSAARALGFVESGVARVRIEVLRWGKSSGQSVKR